LAIAAAAGQPLRARLRHLVAFAARGSAERSDCNTTERVYRGTVRRFVAAIALCLAAACGSGGSIGTTGGRGGSAGAGGLAGQGSSGAGRQGTAGVAGQGTGGAAGIGAASGA
jgi:hypothetical protein